MRYGCFSDVKLLPPPIFRFTVQSMQYKIQVLMFILPITTFHHRFIFGINPEAYPGMLQTFVKPLAIVPKCSILDVHEIPGHVFTKAFFSCNY